MKCERCQGRGVTRWDAFIAGLANLVGALVGFPVEARRCPECRGTGQDGRVAR